jgi:hypothetical protein
MAEGAAGFWSYVRDDDDGDGGRVSALADDLNAQFRILTAEDLELFLDRDSITWGEEWSKRISDAIAGTTFFIPIITPSYFRSNACRQELLKFVREAARLGLEQLLMPVYWASVDELETQGEDSGDEAIRAVAKYNWEDLRDERLEDRDSSDYRKAVGRLAAELAKRVTVVTESVQDVPTRSDSEHDPSDGDSGPGVLEHLAKSEDAMPHLTDVLNAIGAEIRDVGAIVAKAAEEADAAVARGLGVKTALSITERLAQNLNDPAGRIEEQGRDYVATLGELDPGIHARLDLIADQDERGEEQDEFLEVIGEMAEAADEALDQLGELVQSARQMGTYSRSLRAPVRKMTAGLQGVLDGRAIIAEWGRRADELRGARPNAADLTVPDVAERDEEKGSK